ncbi:MAG: hypothetical protein WCD42_08725 [Rhizomicrobium sp.]
MSFKTLTIATVLIAGFGFAVSASAGDAKLADCVHMAKQASTAMDTAQPGDSTDQAKDLVRNARSYCATSQYDRGVALYSKALNLLGKN